MGKSLLILGAGGHGRVVLECAELMGCYEVITVATNRPDSDHIDGVTLVDERVLFEKEAIGRYDEVVVAIGDNLTRKRKMDSISQLGLPFATLIHPTASVSPRSTISSGTVILAQSVVNANARVGKGCILNTASVVEHDCEVGEYVHLSPRACMGGGSKVGSLSWVCMGAIVSDHIAVKENTTLGAGAVLLEPALHSGLYVGIPARLKKKL